MLNQNSRIGCIYIYIMPANFCIPCLAIATAEALAAQVSEENYAKGLIYPPFTNIRKISANIAAKVAAKAYELGKYSYGETGIYKRH